MLHFTQNLEYYIKTRAIQSICNELANQLKEIENYGALVLAKRVE
jgi:hypothetical protein